MPLPGNLHSKCTTVGMQLLAWWELNCLVSCSAHYGTQGDYENVKTVSWELFINAELQVYCIFILMSILNKVWLQSLFAVWL